MGQLKYGVLLGLTFASWLHVSHATGERKKFDVLDYVDPLIGTIKGGHVFAGATLPFGMAKAVADVNNADENQGGFASDDSEITGFSHMHDSGTGGGASLGNFPLFPIPGCRDDNLDNCLFSKYERATKRKNGSVEARPGYFAIGLSSSIHTEMTVTEHTALYRFTFPSNKTRRPDNQTLPNSPMIIVDLTDLQNSISDGLIDVNNSTGRITGNGSFYPSFGTGTYNLSFCADFTGAPLRNAGYFNSLHRAKTARQVDESPGPRPAGGWVQFKPSFNNQILARVGVSFVSVEQACRHAENEIPKFEFEKVRLAAEAAWRKKLSVVEIDATGVSDEFQITFWSGIYRTMISPQDYTGENYRWESKEPYYDSFYCIWDSFRSVHPLLTLLDPESQTRMVRSLIDIYRFEGKLPDCRMSLCKGWTQGGSNADVVLADAYLKNITAGVDWATAYKAVISDAEVEPLYWYYEGRGGLESWKGIGYIPMDDNDTIGAGTMTRSVSRTVEYAYNDFCIAEMAKDLGKPGDVEKYLGRSTNWKNVFKHDQISLVENTTGNINKTVDTGFTGFLMPRYTNGTFGYQDPAFCSPLLEFTSCYLNSDGHETYEGSSWMYTFYVPQDMATLVKTLGGPETFSKRLSYLHTSGLLYIGDEQAFLPVFQFHYAGRPGLSSYFSHFYIPSQFNTTLEGIAGNDDSGAMGSFIALAMMGTWPVAGQDVYLLTPPYFPEVRVKNGQTGKVATIRNINFDPDYKDIYIQSATLNGKPYTKNWIKHSFWLEGGVLEFKLGRKESSWGTAAADLPPSSSTSRNDD